MKKHKVYLKMEEYIGKETMVMVWFVLKSVVYFAGLYGIIHLYIGITSPGGRVYSPFLSEHLDLAGGFRRFLLWGGSLFARMLGYPATYSDYHMHITGGSSVKMVYSCMGYGIMSVYSALILAWPSAWKRKILHLTGGLIMIILLNVIRIGGLAVVYTEGHYGFFRFIDHHDIFNIVVYTCILIYFYFYTRGKVA
ncbi:MAG: exosortase/archaeosortase family protein [Cyclobacteriaceae bacterium]|nr:exosortase/archaeosortase family protein [Cyclobacteriaceae bacterium]